LHGAVEPTAKRDLFFQPPPEGAAEVPVCHVLVGECSHEELAVRERCNVELVAAPEKDFDVRERQSPRRTPKMCADAYPARRGEALESELPTQARARTVRCDDQARVPLLTVDLDAGDPPVLHDYRFDARA
jgi:hypothetical protein